MRMADYMCLSFKVANSKYIKEHIGSVIPEFNQDFLNAQYKSDTINIWWDKKDRESRIKAFDKLIEIYSK